MMIEKVKEYLKKVDLLCYCEMWFKYYGGQGETRD